MESAAQSVVSKLGQLAADELQEIRGVGDKVVQLMDELSTMNAVLRMISEADQSAVDHLVREWEKQVRELAYDAEDCADVYWLRVNRPIPLLRYIAKWPRYILEKLLLQRTLAADVKALLERTIAVSERRVRYGIDRNTLPRSPWFAPAAAVSAASMSANSLRRTDDPDDQLVGIREQVDTLADRIKAVHVEDDKRLKVFSIVGFGGLGKTTLAVELCRRLDADFQRQALVSVSQAFDGDKDMKGLLARVLQQIVKPNEDDDKQTNGNGRLKIDEMDVEGLSSKLKELLKDKRYLIVIDDVWSVPAWEAIRVRLAENKCSSRVIVTTRIETVAKASSVSEHFVHHMKPLELEDSKKLFVKRVFGSMSGDMCPDGLTDTMDKILKKCGGLPLAIVSIASLLASYNSIESVEMWTKVSNSIGSQMESHPTLEGMRQVITLSYDYLPHHLKACMMYLSIFPEDYVISKDRLLYKWIAGGLVAKKRGLTLFDTAEEYFNELISRNMIQPDKLLIRRNFMPYEEIVDAGRVHDMMLEVMVSKSQEANFVSLVGQQDGGLPHGRVRRLSIHGNDENEHRSGPNNKKKKMEVERRGHVRHGGIEAMNPHHVRSLTTFQSEGLDKLLDRLGEFRLLRVLDLEDCKALKNKHMRDICQLYLLRFLGLRGTTISVMPSRVGDLEYLETLDVERTKINDMPTTVTKLSRLEHLRVPQWILPRGLANMRALRDVSRACLKGGDVEVAREIGELRQLQLLVLWIETGEQDPKEELLHALASSLSKTFALRSLELITNGLPGLPFLEFLLDVSSPPPLLRHLVVAGSISRVPEWISSLKHLTELSMYWTRLAGDQLLDSLCELPNLQSIQLGPTSCRDPELVARSTHGFSSLRVLNLSSTAKYPEAVKFEEGSMIKLETILLEFSTEERTIIGTENLKNLKEVKLSGYQNNPSVERALKQLKESESRPKHNQIKVAVEYHW